MPGVPGQRSGVPPKRADQRRRRNKPDPNLGEITRAPGAAEVPVPPPLEGWHPLALGLYAAAEGSGQAQFYEKSDWAVLQVMCESLSRDLKPTPLVDSEGAAVLDAAGRPMMRLLPLRGASLSAYLRGFQSLMLTEGDRRRLRLELERLKPGKPADPDVPNLDDYRDRIAAG